MQDFWLAVKISFFGTYQDAGTGILRAVCILCINFPARVPYYWRKISTFVY